MLKKKKGKMCKKFGFKEQVSYLCLYVAISLRVFSNDIFGGTLTTQPGQKKKPPPRPPPPKFNYNHTQYQKDQKPRKPVRIVIYEVCL